MSSGDTPAVAATRVFMSFRSARRGVMHADERRRVKKVCLRKLEDELIEVFRRYAKRVHQGRLDGAGYLGDTGLVITTFDDVDSGEWHGIASFIVFNRWTAGPRRSSSGLPKA